jgi:hypothetical protein
MRLVLKQNVPNAEFIAVNIEECPEMRRFPHNIQLTIIEPVNKAVPF